MAAWMVVAGVLIQYPSADLETSSPITVGCDEGNLAQLVKMRRSRIGDADGVSTRVCRQCRGHSWTRLPTRVPLLPTNYGWAGVSEDN